MRTTIVLLGPILFLAGCGRNAKSYLDKGNQLFAEGKYADASINYRNCLKRAPRWGEAHYRLGLAELKQQNSYVAVEEFRTAVELTPDRDDFRVQLADAALNLYQTDTSKPKALYDQVAGTADYLLKRNPNSFDGLRFHADVLAMDGRLDEALAIYKKADAIKPFEPQVVLGMTQILFRLNQPAEAETLAREFLAKHKDVGRVYDVLLGYLIQTKRMPEAESLLKSKVANMPKDPYPILQLATFYRKFQGEPEMSRTLQTILSDPQDFPTGHALVGDFYASFGQWDDALEQYKQGLQSKDRTTYQKKMASVYAALHKRDEAIAELDEVVKASPEDLDARLRRALLLRESGDPKKLDLAVADLSALVQKRPTGPALRYNLGLALLAKGDVKSAHAQMAESARLQRDYVAPRVILAEMALKSRNYADAMRIAGEVLAVEPNNSDAKLWRCEALLGTQSLTQAHTELEMLHRQFPESLNVNLNLAFLATLEKRYRDAESQYLRLYKPGQKDMRPLEGLIQVYGAENQIDKGLKLTEQEVKIAPDSRPARLLLAATAIRAGKLDMAIQQYEWLLSNDPRSVEAYASLGEVYQLKGDLNSALVSFQKARELVPNDPRILGIVAMLQTASGQNKEAIASYRQQLAANPEDGIAMNNLAFRLAEAGTDLDQALSLAEAAQRKLPNNADIADTLAWVYVKKGLNESAIQILNGLLRKYPDSPLLRYHLGVALLQAGKLPEAKAEFIIGLSKKPPKDMAEKMKEIVAKIG